LQYGTLPNICETPEDRIRPERIFICFESHLPCQGFGVSFSGQFSAGQGNSERNRPVIFDQTVLKFSIHLISDDSIILIGESGMILR